MKLKRTCSGGCSWTDFCSSGTAATPTVNNNTVASGNKMHIQLLAARPPLPPTMRGIIASRKLTNYDFCVNLSNVNHLLSSATWVANFILETRIISGTPRRYTSRSHRAIERATWGEITILLPHWSPHQTADWTSNIMTSHYWLTCTTESSVIGQSHCQLETLEKW